MQWESDGRQSSFISCDMTVQMESERMCEKGSDGHSSVYDNSEPAWTGSGDSLIVLANGRPEF